MTTTTRTRRVARVFQEPTGLWHWCDDALDHLDARGRGYPSAAAAARAAGAEGYTHSNQSGRVRPIRAEG